MLKEREWTACLDVSRMNVKDGGSEERMRCDATLGDLMGFNYGVHCRTSLRCRESCLESPCGGGGKGREEQGRLLCRLAVQLS